jgi:hypothetical protein
VDTMWGFHDGECKFKPMAGPQGLPQSMLSSGMFPYELTNGTGMGGCPAGYQPGVQDVTGAYGCMSGNTFIDMPPRPQAQMTHVDKFVMAKMSKDDKDQATNYGLKRNNPANTTYWVEYSPGSWEAVIYISKHVGALTVDQLQILYQEAHALAPDSEHAIRLGKYLSELQRVVRAGQAGGPPASRRSYVHTGL